MKTFNSNDGFLGTMSFTGCSFDGIYFGRISNAAGLTFNEGCTFQNWGSSFNADKSAFAFSTAAPASGLSLARLDQDTMKVTAAENTAGVSWNRLIDTVTETWVIGSTPVYDLGTVTIGDNAYTPVFSDVGVLTADGASDTATMTGGPQLAGNITLYTCIDFNVYVPAASEITAINGVAVGDLDTVTEADVSYYKIPYDTIAPKDAYKTQRVVLTVAYGEGELLVTRNVSVLGYAKALFASSANENEIALMKAALAYIKATSESFGTATEHSSAAIDALLGDYTASAWDAEGKNIIAIPEGLTSIAGAALDLESTPGFVVYVSEGVGEVTVNGKTYPVDSLNRTEYEGETVCYLVVNVGVRYMLDTIEISAGGETVTYNLDTYISRTGVPAYAEELYAYALAAKTYILNQ